jgi:hypothetical protein
MIDFLASTTIALIVIMTLVIFISNQRQAGILKQMKLVMEDWYQAQMRDRRDTFKERISMPDVLKWIGSQANLTVIEQGRRLANPPAVEFLTSEGARLVVSPLARQKLVADLKASEGKRRKVARLVEPLLGFHPRKTQMIERSNKSVHEWFEVEIETAIQKLDLNWVNVSTLYFYIIPQEPEKQITPLVSIDMQNLRSGFNYSFEKVRGWFKQPIKQFSTEPTVPKKSAAATAPKKPVAAKKINKTTETKKKGE